MRIRIDRARVAALVLLGVVALAAGSIAYASAPTEVSLDSRPLPALPSHPHGAQDSLFDPGHAVYASSTVYTLDHPLWVTSIAYRVRNAPDAVLHHADVLDVARTSQTCPGMPLVLASVDHQTSHDVRFPVSYALYLPTGTKLYLDAMFHNPDPPDGPGGTYEQVSVDITLYGTQHPVIPEKDLIPLYLGLSDHSPCPPLTFTVPPKQSPFFIGARPQDARFATYTFPTCGEIVLHGAHMHPWDGGIALYLLLNGAVRAVDMPHRTGSAAWEWSMGASTEPIPVRTGDTASLLAQYEHPGPIAESGEMGIELLYYHPETSCTPAGSTR